MSNEIEIRVIQKPSHVVFNCPACECDNEIEYKEFTDLMGLDYPGDWAEVECVKCGVTLKIDNVNWD